MSHRSVDQYRAIAEAIERADPEAVKKAMRQYLQDAYLGFISGLTTDNAGPFWSVSPAIVIGKDDH
jgi:DNA-binding GntR family transcriptional regulator